MSLLFLIFLDIFLASVEALGRIRPLTPWEGEQTCGLHWQRLFRGMETRSSKARSSKSESWLGFFPVNPLLMYSKGGSVQMCLALQIFILVGCTWKVDKGWKRGCIFSAHTWGTQRPKHCQHGIRTRTRPVCENGRGLQAMSKVIKVQSSAGTVRKAGYLHKRRDWSKTRGDVGELHHLFEDWGAAVMCSPWQGWIGWIGWL